MLKQQGTVLLAAELQKLLCAAIQEENKLDVVRKLLTEDGADPTVPGPDDPTRPPLHLAAAAGLLEVVKLMLAHNADVHQARTDNGATSLWIAAMKDHLAVAQLLVQHNANINQASYEGRNHPVESRHAERPR